MVETVDPKKSDLNGILNYADARLGLAVLKLTVCLFAYNLMCCASNIKQDIQEVLTLAPWHLFSTDSNCSSSLDVCSANEIRQSGSLSLEHYANSSLSDDEATARVTALNHAVGDLLTKAGWSRLGIGSEDRSVPRLVGLYKKGKATAQVSLTSARCTMNSSPCYAFDGLQLQFRVPTTSK